MAEYQIFSDGACDIGFAKAKELGIGLIPFYISIDHETYYKEIQEISLEEYFRYMTEEKGYPKTSLPSIQDYMDAFRPALEAGKDIICITMTRTLTASLESAVTAKSMLEEEFPHAQIHVINSWVATGAQALLLMEMARMQKNGKSLHEVITYAEKAREDARIHFMVGDLSYLEIGGRIGKVATISAGLLKIKPIIILKGGEICAGGICRARKKGLAQIASITANIDTLKADLKEKKAALKKAEKEVAMLEAKKAKADAKAAEEAKKTEAEAVLKKLLASGVSADEILEKLK